MISYNQDFVCILAWSYDRKILVITNHDASLRGRIDGKICLVVTNHDDASLCGCISGEKISYN
jgi:hypothetical protein